MRQVLAGMGTSLGIGTARGRTAPRSEDAFSPLQPVDPSDRPALPALAGRSTRLLVLSSLFPSRVRPRHGIFVETRLRHLVHSGGAIEAKVIAPVPWFPFRSPRFGAYASFAATPRRDMRGGLEVGYPRYPMLPRLGVAFQPESMAWAADREARRLARAGWLPDLIDAHYFYPDGVAAALLAERLGRPFVVTARGTDVNVLAQQRGPSERIVWAAGRAAAVVAVSAALKDELVKLGVDASKIVVLRNGVDFGVFQAQDRTAARRQLALPDDAPLLACVGNLVPEKGQALAIESLARLPGHHLLVVGEGPSRAQLGSLAAARGVADRVRFLPSMPQGALSSVYSAADALLLLSTREGWPNVVLEAMACGTPVVATDVGAVAEMIVRPELGRIVAARDPQLVASSVAELLAARAARETIRAHAALYDWASVSRAQLALFAGILAAERQAGATAC